MIKLTYTDSMKEQDELWKTEKEIPEIMLSLQKDIVKEAELKGFAGVVKFWDWERGNEVVAEVYKDEKEFSDYEDGKLCLKGLNNISGYCLALIENLEEYLNKK